MARPPQRAKKTGDPDVVLDLVLRDGMFFFRLWNKSDQSVRDVTVAFRRKVMGLGGAVEITGLPIWSKLTFMPPGKEIAVPIERSGQFLAMDRGTPLVATVAYTDANGSRWMGSIKHDFGAYSGFPALREKK